MKKYLLAVIILLSFSVFGSAQGGPTTEINLTVMETEPVPLQAGQYADIWVRATNVGTTAADSPSFEIEDNFPFTASGKDRWSPPGDLQPGQNYDFRVQVKVSENAVSGENDLKLRYSSSGNTYFTKDIPLEVRVDDRSLIVTDIDFPRRIPPGSSEQMKVKVENMANSYFRNVDLELDTGELPFSTRDSSRKRVSSIGPGEEATFNYTIDVDGDAEIELYDLPLEFEYQDQAGNQVSMSETTGVYIGGFPNIDIGVEESNIRSPGRGKMTLRVVNRGEGQARFTRLEIQNSEQYEVLSEDSIYIGNMIDDDFQTAEFDLYVREEDKLKIPVEVQYSDGRGEQLENFSVERKMFTADEIRRYGVGNSGTPWIVLVLIALILGAGGFYYWRKRREG